MPDVRHVIHSSAGRTTLFCIIALLALAISDAFAQPNPATDVGEVDAAAYVVRGDLDALEAWSLDSTPGGVVKRVRAMEVGQTVDVPAVGRTSSFQVTLRPAAPVAPDAREISANASVFVVADTHGEYEILNEMLQKHHIIDESMRWSFGRGHLVFLGDVFDRGPHQTEILWLIYKLEAEAARAGGGVHLVLGNHEVMVLSGDQRYLNPKYVRTAQALGVESYAELFGARTVLGQWLRTKPAVLKVGDLLCVHGGISRAVVERGLSLQQLNAAVRSVLKGDGLHDAANRRRAQFVMGELGPLWYRGYFAEQKRFPAATEVDIDVIRKHFGVDAILVGHTRVETVTPLYDGRVIAVQVYPRRDETSDNPMMEALRIDGARFLRASIDGTTEPL